MTYSVERALAYQNLTRWHEANRAKLKGVSRHDADWLLALSVIEALPSDVMQPTPTELTAAEILRLICAIETSIKTGEARKLFDGIPEIITLANYLKLSVDTLEKMTEYYPVSIKDKTTIEHYTPDVASDTRAAKDATKAGTNVKTWDDARLRALWEESIMPGVTKTSLANKHGVTRQRIGALLKDAKNKFSTMKSSPQNKNSWGQLINK